MKDCRCQHHFDPQLSCDVEGGDCRTVPRPCINGCVWADTGHQRHATYGRACKRCFWRLRQRVLDLVAAHGWLGQQMGRLSSGWEAPVSGTKDHDPRWLGVHDLRTELGDLLRLWAAEVAEERAQCLVVPASDVPRVATYLLTHLSWVCAQPWLEDFQDEIGDMLRTVRGACPWEREAKRLPVPCESCGLLSLVLFGGDDFVTCTNRATCDEVAVPWWKYLRWTKRLAEEHGLAEEAVA